MHSLVFMGSPQFALPTLQALAQDYRVVGVVTQPDRPAGRGRDLTPPPVKLLAVELGIPVDQPGRLRHPDAIAQLQNWQPDFIVVAAFGQILPSQVLDLPPHGCLNVHASLLPRWRGAAPIQAAILHGDEQTGVTIMQMDPGLDTGPILSQRATPIQPEDTSGSLSQRLAQLGADLLIDTLPGYLRDEITPQPQDDSQATLAPMLLKSAGQLDFNQPALHLARQVRALSPWPGAYTHWKGKLLKVHRAHAVDAPAGEPGRPVLRNGLPAFSTAQGLLVLDQVQLAGKKAMPGQTFLQGAQEWGRR